MSRNKLIGLILVVFSVMSLGVFSTLQYFFLHVWSPPNDMPVRFLIDFVLTLLTGVVGGIIGISAAGNVK